jgi:fucose permease
VAVFCYSMGGGRTEGVISPLIDAIPGDAKAASMSLLHSFYSWGQCLVVLVTTVLLRFVGDGLWGLLPCLWALIPLADMILFCFVPIPPMTEEKQTGNRLSDLLCKPLFYLFILLMICGGAAEMTMSQWASLFAEKALGVSKVTGDILGPCFFGVLMGLGRVGYGLWGQKYRIAPALFGCSVLTLICYLLSVFGSLPVFSLIGCGFCGLGVSLMWPGVLSLSSGKYPMAGAPMFAVLALAGDLGCSVGPWFSGIVTDWAKTAHILPIAGIVGDAEQIAMKYGMLAATVFPLLMVIVLAVYLMRERKGKRISSE